MKNKVIEYPQTELFQIKDPGNSKDIPRKDPKITSGVVPRCTSWIIEGRLRQSKIAPIMQQQSSQFVLNASFLASQIFPEMHQFLLELNYQTLAEAQQSQTIESVTQVVSLIANLANKVVPAAFVANLTNDTTCIDCKFGHQAWRHLDWLQICPPGNATCNSCTFGHYLHCCIL